MSPVLSGAGRLRDDVCAGRRARTQQIVGAWCLTLEEASFGGLAGMALWLGYIRTRRPWC